jgi:hypothetical protein
MTERDSDERTGKEMESEGENGKERKRSDRRNGTERNEAENGK